MCKKMADNLEEFQKFKTLTCEYIELLLFSFKALRTNHAQLEKENEGLKEEYKQLKEYNQRLETYCCNNSDIDLCGVCEQYFNINEGCAVSRYNKSICFRCKNKNLKTITNFFD